MIVGKKVTVVHDNKHVLWNVDFTIQQGRITSFIGPSGAGKTTLLRCLANLVPAYDGDIFYQGRRMQSLSTAERVHAIGFVFQQFHLFPHFTVMQNCLHPMIHVLGKSEREASKRALEVLASLGMQSLAHVRPSRLSGGQQQRAALARALCLEPQVLLFDEPTSALDPESSSAVHAIIRDLIHRGYTVVVSSHDMLFLKKILDRVYFLQAGSIVESFDIREGALDHAGPIARFLHGDEAERDR